MNVHKLRQGIIESIQLKRSVLELLAQKLRLDLSPAEATQTRLTYDFLNANLEELDQILNDVQACCDKDSV